MTIDIDRVVGDDGQWDLIKNNTFRRNSFLVALIRMLNAEHDSGGAIISLDGPWGSGKTYTIKQLECIWARSENPFGGNELSDRQLEIFRNGYIPIYYNAWQNDFAPDASQSLLLNLINVLYEKENIITKSERKLMGSLNLGEMIKNCTLDGIDLKMGEIGKDASELAKETYISKKLVEKISELMKKPVELNEQCKLVFIIDDIDRCKPTFAVKLLEAIKYHINSENVIFLVATNVSELGNIVKGYYGGYIDGHAYLDRIFDLQIGIEEMPQDVYLKTKLVGQPYFAIEMAKYLHLSMREMNRYANIMNLCANYMEPHMASSAKSKAFSDLCKMVFLPIFVGHRIKNRTAYDALVGGEGFQYIERLLQDPELEEYMVGLLPEKGNVIIDDKKRLKEYYDDLFLDIPYPGVNIRKDFWQALRLTSRNIY